jgi:hypothetical protein
MLLVLQLVLMMTGVDVLNQKDHEGEHIAQDETVTHFGKKNLGT